MTEATDKAAQDLFTLFKGLDRAHGVYNTAKPGEAGEKVKGRAMTMMDPLTVDLWKEHLAGRKGLGVIPIRSDSTCVWGVIDVDQYDLDIVKLSRDLRELPFVLCRSKSGGGHVFLFVAEPIAAEAMQAKLRECAQALGYGDCEIFPKQTRLLPGDAGNWLNMPYFGGRRTTRYALVNGRPVKTLKKFIEIIENSRLTIDEFKKLRVVANVETMPLPEGPPCLQHLVKAGFPEGCRNNGLFNLGIYAKKVSPDNWEKDLEGMNHRFMQPPLSTAEVLNVIKQLRKKDYTYKCRDEPIHSHCSADLCRTRKFGVGDDSFDFPTLQSLVKMNTSPPSYYLDVDSVRIGPLEGKDLIEQRRFALKVFEAANVAVVPMKSGTWRKLLKKMLEKMTIVTFPEDNSPEGILWQYLEQFAATRLRSDSRDDLLRGKPYLDNGRVIFRIKDFVEYLEKRKFREYKTPKIAAILRTRGAEHLGMNIRGKFLNLWSIPAFPEQTEDLDIPPTGQDEY